MKMRSSHSNGDISKLLNKGKRKHDASSDDATHPKSKMHRAQPDDSTEFKIDTSTDQAPEPAVTTPSSFTPAPFKTSKLQRIPLSDLEAIQKILNNFTVLPSKKTQHHGEKKSHLELRPIHCLTQAVGVQLHGIFTNTLIKEGDEIIEYTGVLVPRKKVMSKGFDRSYIMTPASDDSTVEPTHLIDAKHEGSLARFINHSENPNMAFMNVKKKVVAVALRDILPGEQLVYDYGALYELYNKIANQAHCDDLSPPEKFATLKDEYEVNVDNINKAVLDAILRLVPHTASQKIFVPKVAQQSIKNPQSLFRKRIYIDAPVWTAELNAKRKYEITENQYGLTMLMVACYLGDEAGVKFLLKSGADINRHTSDFKTPMHFALNGISKDKTKIIKLLKKYSADPLIEDSDNETIIHQCIKDKSDHIKTVMPQHLRLSEFKSFPLQYALDHKNYPGFIALLDHASKTSFHECVFECVGKKKDDASWQLTTVGEKLKQSLTGIAKSDRTGVYNAVLTASLSNIQLRLLCSSIEMIQHCIKDRYINYLGHLLPRKINLAKYKPDILEYAIDQTRYAPVAFIIKRATSESLQQTLFENIKKDKLSPVGIKLKALLKGANEEQFAEIHDFLKSKIVSKKLLDTERRKNISSTRFVPTLFAAAPGSKRPIKTPRELKGTEYELQRTKPEPKHSVDLAAKVKSSTHATKRRNSMQNL